MYDFSRLKDPSPRWVKTVADRATRTYALATVSARPGPDFLVVGTKRGGTTSLFNYLLLHPALLGLFPQSRLKKSTDFFTREYHRGESWYRSHFHTRWYRERLQSRLGDRPLGGEASPYYLYDPRVAPRVAALNPDLKAVALLRNPVERAWSHHQERRHMGVEPLSFDAALAAEQDRTAGELDRMNADPGYYSSAHDWYSYRDRGIYLPQLQAWEQYFPRDQMLALTSEDMYADVQLTFDRICAFLEVSPRKLPPVRTFNALTRSPIPSGVREELSTFYAPHNRALEQYLGHPLGWD